MNKTCENCKYWKKWINDKNGWGECEKLTDQKYILVYYDPAPVHPDFGCILWKEKDGNHEG